MESNRVQELYIIRIMEQNNDIKVLLWGLSVTVDNCCKLLGFVYSISIFSVLNVVSRLMSLPLGMKKYHGMFSIARHVCHMTDFGGMKVYLYELVLPVTSTGCSISILSAAS